MKLNSKDKFILLKGAEELAELAVELLQGVNKPSKNNWGKINDEIKDVEKYLEKIKLLSNNDWTMEFLDGYFHYPLSSLRTCKWF